MRLAALCLCALACSAQNFSQRGFFEVNSFFFPQTAPNDSSHAVAEALFRYEPSYKTNAGWQFNGSFDMRTDTHHEVERKLHLSWADREIQRPAFDVRRLSATYNRGPVTLEVGRQFIRWGKTDILTPTDRFAPRDYINVVDNDFLGVVGTRLTVEQGGNTVDAVWLPVFTPSRIPLLNQRWVVLPQNIPPGLQIRDLGARYPGGSQFGVRFNHVGAGYEAALSFYDGFNNLPLLDTRTQAFPLRVDIQRFYPQMRMYGADAAVPLSILTLKGEAAYYTSTTPQADEYMLYVIQLERQAGEWFFVGGYAGQWTTQRRGVLDFAPDRGLAKALVARAGYTIDTNRSIALETAVRQNGKGLWTTLEYSQAVGQHWRATTALTLIRGSENDFLGQYRRNSHATVALRYSF